MRTIRRALRTIVRNPLRTGLLVAVLGASMGLTLIMITVNEAFGERLDEIRAEVGTNVAISPAGSSRGFAGGADGDLLSEDEIENLTSLEHVESVQATLSMQYSGEELESAVNPDDLADRFAGGTPPAGNLPEGENPFTGENLPTPPEGAPSGASPGGLGASVMVTGIDDPNSLSATGAQDVEITSGRTFTEDETDADVAVLGADLAETNDLLLGDTFELQGESIKVIGIYSSDTQFGDNSIFIPLKALQSLFDSEGEISTTSVKVDTVDHVEAVADAIRNTLGEDTVDVTNEASRFESISAPIADAEDSSQIGMIAGLVASAAVILFSVGLVARQRVKEIGILKASGASNWHVTAQFAIETAVMSVAAALLGALATFPLAQTVADALVSDSAAPAGAGAGQQAAAQLQGAGGFLGDVDVTVSPEVFLYALVIAVALTAVASIVPAWYAGRVKPAEEVLRHE